MGIKFSPKDATVLIEMAPNCYVNLNGLKFSGKWEPGKGPDGKPRRVWKGDQVWVTPALAARASNTDYDEKGQQNRPWGRVIGQKALDTPSPEAKDKKQRVAVS